MKPLGIILGSLALVLLMFLPLGSSPDVQPPGEERNKLTFGQMSGDDAMPKGPIHNAHFMPVGVQAMALHQLVGTLEVEALPVKRIRDGFPAFSARFFTHDGHLVPVERDIIPGNDSFWDIIVSPGKVWSEAADQGWSRASFPFVLVSRVWNESHNGIATFIYNGAQVSKLSIQIVQESSPWSKFDGWAQLPLRFTLEKPNGLNALIKGFEQERENQFPIRPWSDLDLPDGVDPLATFDGDAKHVTVSGLVVDGVLYAQPCRTRYGDFPYCSALRHGVFSVTKSSGAALTLFWLAEQYGDEVYDLQITDYVDVTADHDGWDEVTFGHVLNMMTGVGEKAPGRKPSANSFEADDEDNELFERFGGALGAVDKLEVAFSVDNYSWGPGEVGRYNTLQTFVLSAAMDAFLKEEEGEDANLWDRVVEEVLKPIGIEYAPMMHTQEADGSRGIPMMGYGYLPTLGEVAKLAQLFHDGGHHEGEQLLDAEKIEELFSNSSDIGYPLFWRNEAAAYRYHLSFWLMPFEGEDECILWVPEMIGLGGNIVALMPNGMTAIRFADGDDNAVNNSDGESMADIADSLESFCD